MTKTKQKTRDQLVHELAQAQATIKHMEDVASTLRNSMNRQTARADALAAIVARIDHRCAYLEGVLHRIEQEERQRFCSENRVTESAGNMVHTGPALQNFNGEVNFAAGMFGIPGEPTPPARSEPGTFSSSKAWYEI